MATLPELGISSETLLAVYLGLDAERPGCPYDESDWGRCDRLMDALDLTETQRNGLLWRTAKKYPEWTKAIEERKLLQVPHE